MKSQSLNLLTWSFLTMSLALHGAVQEVWVNRYYAGHSVSTNVVMGLDAQGNIIIGGSGTSTNGDYDYLVLKYSAGGTLVWSARYDSAPGSNDQVRAMALDADGNVYVTGTSRTVKYSGNGVLQWVAPYGARGLALDPHGDVCITGFSEASYATAKIHKEAGTNLWLRTFSYLNRPGYGDISKTIAVDSRSNIYVGGIVFCHIGHPIYDVYQNRLVLGYDAQGNQFMATTPFPTGCYNTRNNINAVGLGVDSEGNAYDSVNAELGGAWIMKYNSTGAVQWQTYGDYGANGFGAMVCDDNGFVYLTGISVNPALSINTEVISPAGSNVWTAVHLDNTSRAGKAVTIRGNGQVIAVGVVRTNGTGDDYITLKYDRDGREQWCKLYNGPGNGTDTATAVVAAPDGSVYVSGTSANTNGVVEITTIKYVEYQPIAWQPGGTVLLEFAATNSQPCRIQASTDLTAWDDLATVTPDANRIAHYTDTSAASFPYRFYRMLCP